MFRVTLDVFFGRANPSWIVTGLPAQEALRAIALNRGMISAVKPVYCTGYRGTQIELLSDELSSLYGLPDHFTIASAGAADLSAGIALTQQLIAAATDRLGEHYDDLARTHIATELAAVRAPPSIALLSADASASGPELAAMEPPVRGCTVESGPYNPAFWSGPRQRTNNCYAYAANKPTGHWAQIPGAGSGHPVTRYTPQDVAAATKRDGGHDVDVCFDQSESPRWLVALVICPGIDFHWYRHSKEGFWGHKPAQYEVTNLDCSGKLLIDPKHCDRGRYTQFYGYMILPKSIRLL